MDGTDQYPFCAYIGGVGSGKTHTLILQALREASIPGTRGLIGAPSYRMLYDVTMKKFFELCPESWIENYSVTRNFVLLKNGSEIIFRSFDNEDSLQGHDLDWFGGDEMGLTTIGVFRQMQARLRRPGGRHKGFVVGNPSGPTHWTYDYFVLKAQQYPETYKLISATSYENSFIPDSYTSEMEKSYGKDSLYYKRFVLGEFVAFEGAYWPNFNIRFHPEGHILHGRLEDGLPTLAELNLVLKPQSEVAWNWGRVLDFGFEHPWVLMWWVHDGNTIVFFDEYYQRHSTIREHMMTIKAHEKVHRALYGAHVPAVSWTDHDAQGRWEVQNCLDLEGNNIGFNCSPAEKNKAVMDSIICVQSLIEQNRLFISGACEHARIEIPSYRAKPMEGKGKTAKEEPIKEKDDTCDCLRMACWMELRGVTSFMREEKMPLIVPARVTPSNIAQEFQEYGANLLNG